jgi:hypothetical protein
MNQKIKGLLSFALGGVVLTYIIMSIFNVPILLQGNDLALARIYFLLAAFIGFLLLGYGLILINKETKPNT